MTTNISIDVGGRAAEEDIFYMTQRGSKWFPTPIHLIDDPFGCHA